MKKAYIAILMIAAAAAFIPMLVLAEDTFDEANLFETDQRNEKLLELIDEESSLNPTDMISSRCEGKILKVRGKWGVGYNETPSGFWGGRISFRSTSQGVWVGVSKGRYNFTDSQEYSNFVCIMKKGYVNGKIIKDDGTEITLTGLYKVDRAEKLLKMQWMVPHQAGWAVARIQIEE